MALGGSLLPERLGIPGLDNRKNIGEQAGQRPLPDFQGRPWVRRGATMRERLRKFIEGIRRRVKKAGTR